MNTFMSLKRSTRTDKAAPATKGISTPDPLLDSTVALDEIPEEHFSTLKFLDTKREQEKQATADLQQEQQATNPPNPVTASHTKVTPVVSGATGKPSRMQLFRDRVQQERADSLPLPFLTRSATGRTRSAAALVNLTLLSSGAQHAASASLSNPLGELIRNSIKRAEHDAQPATAQGANAPTRSTVAGSAIIGAASQSRYCLTRASERMECLLGAFLPDSQTGKPLSVMLPSADGFDFCAGAADLFTSAGSAGVHRLTEDDLSRQVTIGSAVRLSVDSMTAAHTLRQRSATLPAFTGWFDEDGFPCDEGCSPIETFIQAELLNLQQQSQRMLKQARRLAGHLQTHCPHLQAQEALHDSAQADAWVAQYGNAPQPALYRLLDCPVTAPRQPQGASQAAEQTLLTLWANNPSCMPALRDIDLPHWPAGLQLIRTLARAATSEPSVAHFEQLAILDLLMRQPVQSSTPGEHGIRIDLGCVAPDVLSAWHAAVVQRFSDLGVRLQSAGLSE